MAHKGQKQKKRDVEHKYMINVPLLYLYFR
ncbi:hypothetical protein EDB69_2691 [Vibrio crassostreae]|nr:hypothetical protein EDB64_1567 [Vibrio crassostreae]ROP10727.1 hypothetical protein EDB63_2446 [Vibrio crassostreae]ROQ80395.1 hypothetical protein EDB72_3097 [Vibrio crassostreae]ROR85565.1 hypothetical protein EDB66_2438 [Vibrio crassostreae]RPE93488.1 hypothetical protein EDB68_2450 [Vibrio crassostreae]